MEWRCSECLLDNGVFAECCCVFVERCYAHSERCFILSGRKNTSLQSTNTPLQSTVAQQNKQRVHRTIDHTYFLADTPTDLPKRPVVLVC